MNVILITIDSLRADHLESYGYSKKTTPFLSKLIEDNVLFSDAYSVGPSTRCSIPGILTGTFSSRFGGYNKYLVEGRKTVAEIFKKAGYKTAGFHSNPYLGTEFKYDRGFDFFEEFEEYFYLFRNSREKNSLWLYLKNSGLYLKRLLLRWPYIPAPAINKEVIQFLKKNPDDKYFLWIHYMDVHLPYLNHQKGGVNNKYAWKLFKKVLDNPHSLTGDEVNTLIQLYDGEIRYMDSYLKEFIEALNTMGLYESSLIIITSDHGDEFGEHGSLSHEPKLYEELLRVPLFIHFPEHRFKGKVVRVPVSLLDLAVTMLDVAGINAETMLDGESLIPLIEGGMNKGRGVISEVGLDLFSLRKGTWKLIYNRKTKAKELYNLLFDPKETVNLATREAAVLAEMEQLLNAHIIRCQKNKTEITEEVEYDEKVKKRLRDLGYFD